MKCFKKDNGTIIPFHKIIRIIPQARAQVEGISLDAPYTIIHGSGDQIAGDAVSVSELQRLEAMLDFGETTEGPNVWVHLELMGHVQLWGQMRKMDFDAMAASQRLQTFSFWEWTGKEFKHSIRGGGSVYNLTPMTLDEFATHCDDYDQEYPPTPDFKDHPSYRNRWILYEHGTLVSKGYVDMPREYLPNIPGHGWGSWNHTNEDARMAALVAGLYVLIPAEPAAVDTSNDDNVIDAEFEDDDDNDGDCGHDSVF